MDGHDAVNAGAGADVSAGVCSPAAGRENYVGPVKAPPWDAAPSWESHGLLHRLTIDGAPLADYVDGSGAPRFDAPRPHLHPVRTPSGTVVSDAAARDHTWHVGIGIGVQDVGGNNLWGGRTYREGTGYTWSRDHGRIRHDSWLTQAPGMLVESLTWLDADDASLLAETRTLRWSSCAAPVAGSILELSTALTVAPGRDEPVELGGPGSHGRTGGGYGGFFWRLPACVDVDLRTPVAHGEGSVHGSVPSTGATWLAWSARTRAPGPDGAPGAEFTVAVTPIDAVTADDPWFVRVADYPGIGSALAWSEPTVVTRDRAVHRGFRCLVADARVPDAEIGAALMPARR